MTAEEVRTYLKSYRNLKDKADYLQNKLINVKAISYRDSPTGSYSEPKTQNDYILMKDRCLEEMALIRQNIDKLDDINHRDDHNLWLLLHIHRFQFHCSFASTIAKYRVPSFSISETKWLTCWER